MLRKPSEFSGATTTELLDLHFKLTELKRAWTNSFEREYFKKLYPEIRQLAEVSYEEMAAYHTLLCEAVTQGNLTKKVFGSWKEPMYRGRGCLPYEELDWESFNRFYKQPETITIGGSSR